MEKKGRKIDWYLTAITVMSLFLNVFGIWKDKYSNSYYTAAVASMMENFKSFFFGSLDPVGFVTVDKPPVVFWIQTLFAKIFGLYGWSVILPQALANVGSVLLLYFLLKPTFGKLAARMGALILALTPIAVVISRSNNIDGMLVFALLLGTWMLMKGVRDKKAGWIIGAFAMIGVAFNMKMLQAYMIVPAFYLFYWIAVKLNWKKKLGILSGATAVMLVISVSWAVIVDSIPADKRPYIGSSQTNSVLELAFGYNGVSRLTGDRNNGGGGGFGGQAPSGSIERSDRSGAQNGTSGADGGQAPAGANGNNQGQTAPFGRDGQSGQNGQAPGGSQNGGNGGTMPQGGRDGQAGTTGTTGTTGNDAVAAASQGTDGEQGQQPGFGDDGGAGGQVPGGMGQMPGGDGGTNRSGGGGGMFNTGQAGVFRLFQSELSGQASWLLPFALLASIGLLSGIRFRRSMTDREKETLFWLAWLIPVGGFFSIAGFFHQYYLIMLAPPVAALAGAGWSALWSFYRDKQGWKAWILPAALLVTTAFELYVLNPYSETMGKGWVIGVGAGGIVVALLLLLRLLENRLAFAASVLGMLVLLAAPGYWSYLPSTQDNPNSSVPAAGPTGSTGFGMGNRNVMAGMIGNFGERDGNRERLNANGTNPFGTNQGGSNQTGTNQDGQTPTDSNRTDTSAANSGGGFNFSRGASSVDQDLINYLTVNNTGEKYLFATTSSQTAAPYIIQTRKAVMAMGGFSGSDPILTVDKLKQMVANGDVKYFLLSGEGGGGRGGSSEVTSWIIENSTAITESEWKSATDTPTSTDSTSGVMGMGGFGGTTLYEIKK
ncbi:glycosyltransferase family 39 protein [Gorillibacterium timonense]|uniref:glycosyltransferase family 39 protein n=1 Tax=Gorillibacterium timonense TaxID=1689269 RepID=UPI00071C6F70|nr:glycosyltransferase family 39 protein [Gorillibacterium timonense]